ncbi:hypothetical protein Srubr_27130 [Streptomyces rubradiris]|uniref:Transposase n=1 Tax=Streptomyces rubradiris TaxID=285531 RepID=A0ABQ3RAI7_STRRR|nr:hypothetical protein [Streptomyces rubradiris]GHI52867.1 hypothetical protein Srubr_27130 [Streptomyces rubradiris]
MDRPLADFNPPDDPNEKDTNAVIIDPYNHRKKRTLGTARSPIPA